MQGRRGEKKKEEKIVQREKRRVAVMIHNRRKTGRPKNVRQTDKQ